MEEDLKTFDGVSDSLKDYTSFEADCLQQLKDDTDETVALKILARFYVTLEESLNLLVSDLKDNHYEGIGKSSHKIAGSADLVGFKDYAKKSRKLSHEVKDSSKREKLHQEVAMYLKEGKEILEVIKKSFPALQKYLN
ncbi:MAG: hypothetical protein ACK41T_05205 [Pseudobdellovibrio sp.]